MTVIKPNSVAGINSITVQSGNSLAIHKSNGELLRTITGTTGVTTFSSISVGAAYTDNSAAKSINIGIGASISQHDAKTLTFGTNGDPRITIDAAGDFNVGTAATIKVGGNATFSGIVTAASFKGDGSGLSGISAGTSLSGSTDNTICTVTGANAIQGETNLKFDGSALSYSSGGSERFNLAHTSGGVVSLKNPSNAALHFGTNDTERVRILANGDVGINTSVINRVDSGRPVVQFDYGGNDGSQGLEVRLSNSYLNGNAATDNAAITYIGQNLGITNRENGVITFRNNGVETIRIQANKKIGLGTDNASSPVHIYGNTGAQGITDYQTLTLQSEDRSGAINTGAGIMFLGHDGSSGAFHGTLRCLKENGTSSNRNSYMSFGTRKNGEDIQEQLRIDSDGNVLVATTVSGVNSGYSGISLGSDSAMVVRRNGVHQYYQALNTGTYTSNVFMSANTTVGSISFNSGATFFNASSDYRLKENVVGITSAITRLKTLIPKRFNFKSDTSRTVDGFLAHEVTAVPEAITGTKDQVAIADDVTSGIATAVGNPIYQQIDQSKLVPLLTAALQEAVTKIETLETKVAALEGG